MDSLAWVYFKSNRTDEALELLNKAIEKVKTDPIIAEHLGDVLSAKGMKEQAAEAYKKSLQNNPDNLVVKQKLKEVETAK
jgi:predicted negative regulator of RcsB-dependent stress response